MTFEVILPFLGSKKGENQLVPSLYCKDNTFSHEIQICFHSFYIYFCLLYFHNFFTFLVWQIVDKTKKDAALLRYILSMLFKPQRMQSPDCAEIYFLPCTSSDTVNFLWPCARRAAKTRRPLAVSIRWRKPCLLFLLRL